MCKRWRHTNVCVLDQSLCIKESDGLGEEAVTQSGHKDLNATLPSCQMAGG